MSKKHERKSILDAIEEAWDILPDTSFGQLILYMAEQEELTEVDDEQFLVYINDFILNNM